MDLVYDCPPVDGNHIFFTAWGVKFETVPGVNQQVRIQRSGDKLTVLQSNQEPQSLLVKDDEKDLGSTVGIRFHLNSVSRGHTILFRAVRISGVTESDDSSDAKKLSQNGDSFWYNAPTF